MCICMHVCGHVHTLGIDSPAVHVDIHNVHGLGIIFIPNKRWGLIWFAKSSYYIYNARHV